MDGSRYKVDDMPQELKEKFLELLKAAGIGYMEDGDTLALLCTLIATVSSTRELLTGQIEIADQLREEVRFLKYKMQEAAALLK